MKNHIAILFILSSLTAITVAQDTIPNASFERWTVRELYDEPVNWNTSNQLSTMLDYTSIFQTSDSYQGNSAMRMVTVDTIAAYAFTNGTITEGNIDGYSYTGGFPVSGAPTSLSGYFKYDIKNDIFSLSSDVAIFTVSFKKNGVPIGQFMEPIIGSSGSYTLKEITIDPLPDVPDSAFIAIISSNPDEPWAGSWVQVDSLWFTGINDAIPNANFENWETESYEDPESWLTSNLLIDMFGSGVSASASTDAIDGTYALRLECVSTIIPDDDGLREGNLGYVLPYTDDAIIGEELPSFPISINPTGLSGYYKFTPHDIDTAMVRVILTSETESEYVFTEYLPAASEYTAFNIDFNYTAHGGDIVAIQVLGSTSKYFDTSLDQHGEAGSVLFLDGLELLNTCGAWATGFEISVDQMPSCNDSTAILDVGTGWGSQTWSTGETTQSIEPKIKIGTYDTISVIVTASDSWCFQTDTVYFTPLNCNNNNITSFNSNDAVRVYPNPVNNMLNLKFLQTNGNYKIELLDMTGKTMFTLDNYKAESDGLFHINMDTYSAGLYLIKVVSKNNKFIQKIQKL